VSLGEDKGPVHAAELDDSDEEEPRRHRTEEDMDTTGIAPVALKSHAAAAANALTGNGVAPVAPVAPGGANGASVAAATNADAMDTN